MKKCLLILSLIISGSAWANMDGMPDFDGDTRRMIHHAGLAVEDHAVRVVGMNSRTVKVGYNYRNGLFLAADSSKGCYFYAQTLMSPKRLSTGHYWRVYEVGANTCNNQ